MNVYLIGLLWVFGAVVIAALLMVVIRRFISDERRDAGDEAAGRVFTVVAGLNAVLVAFVLISLFDAVGAARAGAHQEANSLVEVYWGADLLPEPVRGEIQKMCRSYATTVVNKEWPQMRDNKPVDDTGKVQLDQLHGAIASVIPTSYAQEERQVAVETQLSAAYKARQQRLDAAEIRVSSILWLTLIVGAVLSVGLTCLFGGSKLSTHIIVAATLAGTLTILLFAIYQLQNPFNGGVKVGPDALDSALRQFG
jgi:hypothetical protein